jgi:hypothetical protein
MLYVVLISNTKIAFVCYRRYDFNTSDQSVCLDHVVKNFICNLVGISFIFIQLIK